MDELPDTWLVAAIEYLKGKNATFPFKVLTMNGITRDRARVGTIRVLNANDGSVWRFECSVERGPA